MPLGERRRPAAKEERPLPERLQVDPQAAEGRERPAQRLRPIERDLDLHRDEELLGRDSGPGVSSLEQDALVGRMLVHDLQAVRSLDDDVARLGLPHHPPRLTGRADRRGEEGDRGTDLRGGHEPPTWLPRTRPLRHPPPAEGAQGSPSEEIHHRPL